MNKIEAGTKIIITTPWTGETAYKKGDIFTVNRFHSPGVDVTIGEDKQVYIASDEFEVYTEPEYKVGDRVQITIPEGNADAYGGTYFVTGTGTVREVDGGRVIQVDADTQHPGCGSRDGWWVDKKYVTPLAEEPEQEPLAEWEKELLNVFPRTIAFEDIQEGDRIKAEYTHGGVERTAEGVASKHYARSGGLWTTTEGSAVADSTWSATYTLLERPEPPKPKPKPNPFAEANVGSLATYGGNGVKYLKNAENKWTAITDRGDLLAYGNTDAQMLENGNAAVTYNA